MKTIPQRLHDYWFDSAPATRIALLRILVGAFVLWFFRLEYGDYLEVARTDVRLFAPVGVIFHGPVHDELFRWLLRATMAGAICFTLGLWFRITGPLFAGLLLWLFCYRNSWSMIYHSDNLVALHVLVLGFTRSADALSLDAYLRDRRPAAGPGDGGLSGWQFNWPVQLMCALTVSAYFVSAVAKLSSELGLAWMTGPNLRSQMVVDCIRKELLGGPPNAVSYALYDWLPLFSLLAIGSLCVELFAPLMLLNRWAGRCWAIGAFFFHWGILVVMHIKFHYQLTGVMFLSFFPLERILDWPRQLRRRRRVRADGRPAQPAQPALAARASALPPATVN